MRHYNRAIIGCFVVVVKGHSVLALSYVQVGTIGKAHPIQWSSSLRPLPWYKKPFPGPLNFRFFENLTREHLSSPEAEKTTW